MTIRTLQWLKDRLSEGDVDVPVSFPAGLDSNGNDVLEQRSEQSVTPGFGSWRTPNTDRPTLLLVEARTETDGTVDGTVQLQIDKSGGTAADYTLNVSNTGASKPGGASSTDNVGSVFIPADGSYQVVNANDPNAANTLDNVRETTI